MMIRPRWHKVMADLFSHKVRSLLVIASIAIGLFAIGMITTSYVILSEDIRSGYQAVNPANIQINASDFDDNFVRRIGNLAGIDEAQGVRIVNLRVKAANGEWKPINIKALDGGDMQPQTLNHVNVLQGTWPPEERQIVMDINRVADTGASVGDLIEIKLPSGTVRRMQLVGVVRDQTIGADRSEGGFFLAPMQGFIHRDTLHWLEQPETYNTLYATVDQGKLDRDAIRPVADLVLREFDQRGFTTSGLMIRGSTEHPNVAYVDAMVAVIFMLGFLVVFLSGFLITNTLSALLTQQVEQIGVMKTIGASRRQINSVYMVLILVFSLIALVIAVPLSEQGAFAMLKFMAGSINVDLLGMRPVQASKLLQVLIALIVPQIAGSLPILQGTRISIREALSGTSTAQIDDNGRIYRLLSKIHGISRPLLISLRNTFRQRARLALTLLTLTLGGAIFISTFNVRYSIENYIDRLGRYFIADVNINFSQPYRVDRVIGDIHEMQARVDGENPAVVNIPAVINVEGWGAAQGQLLQEDGTLGENIQLLAQPPDSPLIEPILLEGRWLLPEDENAITLGELFRTEHPDVHIGDTIRLKIGEDEMDWLVVGFFQFAGSNSGLVAYVNNEYLSRQIGMSGRSFSFRVVASGPRSLEAQEALGHQLETYLTGLGYQMTEVRAGLSLQETTSEGLNILTTFLLIMSLLMAAVGSVGLMGTMSLNVMERTREIGVMRAIGGSDRAIINIILVEGCIIGLISWLLASFIALPISKLMADTMFQIIFDTNARLVSNITGNVIWFLLVLLLSILASVIPAFNASRLTIREVLAYD